MKTIKTWEDASKLINSKELLDDFSVNLNFKSINLNVRTENLLLYKNCISGFLSSEHKASSSRDDNKESHKLPNGTVFKYIKDTDKIEIKFYKRSGKKYFIGLADSMPNNFIHESDVYSLKPIANKSINYIGFNDNNLDYEWLSNSSNHSIKYDSFDYKNVESYLKLNRNNPFVKLTSFPDEKHITIHSPGPFTMMGSGKSRYSDVRREHLNITVKTVLNKKLKQHPELIEKLLNTKDSILYFDISDKIKQNMSDYYWGAVLEGDNLLGYNHLGKIWMEIRKRIKNKYK